MNQKQHEKLQKTCDFYNKQAVKDGLTSRMILTDDVKQPFVLVDLLKNECLPPVPKDFKLRIYKEA